MLLPYQFGRCWKCGNEDGPFSLCMHPTFKSNVWLCENCYKDYINKVDKGQNKSIWHASELRQIRTQEN